MRAMRRCVLRAREHEFVRGGKNVGRGGLCIDSSTNRLSHSAGAMLINGGWALAGCGIQTSSSYSRRTKRSIMSTSSSNCETSHSGVVNLEAFKHVIFQGYGRRTL